MAALTRFTASAAAVGSWVLLAFAVLDGAVLGEAAQQEPQHFLPIKQRHAPKVMAV
jgi:hypothetical protein